LIWNLDFCFPTLLTFEVAQNLSPQIILAPLAAKNVFKLSFKNYNCGKQYLLQNVNTPGFDSTKFYVPSKKIPAHYNWQKMPFNFTLKMLRLK